MFAATAGAGSWALVLQQVALWATFAGALWWHSTWHPTFGFSRPAFRQLASFAIRIAGGRWARLIELLVLFLLIGKLVGVPALGAWTFAMSTVILPAIRDRDPDRGGALLGVLPPARRSRAHGSALARERSLSVGRRPAAAGGPCRRRPGPDSHRLWIPVGGLGGDHPDPQRLRDHPLSSVLGPVLLDAVGRPQVTLWTQLTALCTTPVGVVVGAHWGIEAVAVGFVLSQLIAVEIPVLIIVLSELRVSLRSVAARLYAVPAATLLMASICFVERLALSRLGVDVEERAALTIGVACSCMRSPSGCSHQTSFGEPSLSPAGCSQGPWVRVGERSCRLARVPRSRDPYRVERIRGLLRSFSARRITLS